MEMRNSLKLQLVFKAEKDANTKYSNINLDGSHLFPKADIP